MKYYQESYFNEAIFSTDYASLANAIYNAYQPKKVVEFGCGPGNLTRMLGQYNLTIDAVDGYSSPDFGAFSNIKFENVDLNDEQAIINFLGENTYDMAICTEVAEHLNPSSSNHLIKCLTSCASVVVFSAAVPEQNGHGHINCQTRGFWHDLFINNNFRLIDSLRKELRANENLAIWYKLNLLDYMSNNYENGISENEVIRNLIQSESYSSSLFYKKNNENAVNQAYLQYPLVKQYFQARNFLKRKLGR